MVREIDVCPLFDTSNTPYTDCIATNRGCSLELATLYDMCPKYKEIREVMLNE